MRKIFFWVIAFCLLSNLFGDISVYLQSKVETTSGEFVGRSYEVLQDIGAVRSGILETRLRKLDVADLDQAILHLSDITKNDPVLEAGVERLQKLSDEQLLESDPDISIGIVEELFSAERARLKERLITDKESNDKSMHKILFANAIDIILIIAALIFFLYERKQNGSMQTSMMKALSQVEAVNRNLKFKIHKRESKFKTTVHDLKNPLGSIRGFAEILSEDTKDQTVMRLAQIIQQVSNSTLELVGSVLETEGRSDHDVETLKLNSVVQEICSMLKPMALKKQQDLTMAIGAEFEFTAPRQLIENVFYNLIGNAIKFSPIQSQILVETGMENQSYEVRIKDQGPGFSAEDFKSLFQSGAKLSAKPTGDEVSTGIGLFSAKESLDQLGGQIVVSNNSDRGACILIRFPKT